jgi:hypothetical protein
MEYPGLVRQLAACFVAGIITNATLLEIPLQ